jgi:hypothetical protein
MAATVVITIALAAVVILVLWKMRRDKKTFRGCGTGCGGCPFAGSCHRHDPE